MRATSTLSVRWIAALIISTCAASPGRAQTASGDARDVGFGGVNGGARLLSGGGSSAEVEFAIPLGLLQLAAQRQSFEPGARAFDPALVLEYAANPAHFVIGRRPSPARARFMADVREAGLNPDLNVYRGFTPAATLEGGGRLSPVWGHAFTVHASPGAPTHKVYVGAGPYLSLQTAALFDQRLVSMLGASAATYVPSSTLEIGNQSTGQVAMRMTGGYRATIPLGGAGSHIDLEADYNHLHGFRYEAADIDLRLDTNRQGLLAIDPSRGAPLAINRRFSSHGRGFGVDLAAAAAIGKLRLRVATEGIANRIDWRDVTGREYELQRLTGGSARLATVFTAPLGSVRVVMPIVTRLQGAYAGNRFGAVAELERGFPGTTAGAALERRFAAIELRAGARLTNRIVLPAAGVSLKAGRAWFDLGASVSTANIERQRNVVLATSIRFVFDGAATPAIK